MGHPSSSERQLIVECEALEDAPAEVEAYAVGLRVEVRRSAARSGSSRVARAVPEMAVRLWSARSGLRPG